jgi:cation transport protein ChaC
MNTDTNCANTNRANILSEPPLWVFAYGSLIWNPGFAFLSKQKATLHGYHRSFCIYSHVHRGTRERPGLVLGLDRGGACRGLAYQIEVRAHDEILAYLRAREQVTKVYREITINLRLGSGEKVRALTYVADRTHLQYAGRLSLERQLELIRHGHGQSGHNQDYLRNTHEHLATLNIHDHTLDWLVHHL